QLLPVELRAPAPGSGDLAEPPGARGPEEDLDLLGTEIYRPAAQHPTQTERKGTMTTTRSSTKIPKIFRVTLEVSNVDEAAAFYAKLLGKDGKRPPGARHYFDCGGVILSVLDPTGGGLTPTPGPKSLYFAVNDLEAVHARAKALKALAPFKVHGEPAGEA